MCWSVGLLLMASNDGRYCLVSSGMGSCLRGLVIAIDEYLWVIEWMYTQMYAHVWACLQHSCIQYMNYTRTWASTHTPHACVWCIHNTHIYIQHAYTYTRTHLCAYAHMHTHTHTLRIVLILMQHQLACGHPMKSGLEGNLFQFLQSWPEHTQNEPVKINHTKLLLKILHTQITTLPSHAVSFQVLEEFPPK